MFISDVLTVAVRSGFFADDQAAIRAGAEHDGFTYAGEPVTPGFRAIRQPGEAVSVMLVLDDGQVAYGDCAAVQYSGVGGRDGLFEAGRAIGSIERYVAPLLRGAAITDFRAMAATVDGLLAGGERLHTAIRYGVTQTLARGMVVETTHPRFGTVRQVRSPVRVERGEASYRRAPARNEDADDVLHHLPGYDDQRIGELSHGGAFGQAAK